MLQWCEAIEDIPVGIQNHGHYVRDCPVMSKRQRDAETKA
jgi:hypothetical protein